MGELDDPNEPILEESDDDFEDLQEQLYEEQEGTDNVITTLHLPLSFIHLLYIPHLDPEVLSLNPPDSPTTPPFSPPTTSTVYPHTSQPSLTWFLPWPRSQCSSTLST